MLETRIKYKNKELNLTFSWYLWYAYHKTMLKNSHFMANISQEKKTYMEDFWDLKRERGIEKLALVEKNICSENQSYIYHHPPGIW